MKIKPNLHLNMSPQTTEDYGLAFARNMKLDDDGNLVSDYGFKEITNMASKNIVGHIVGLDNKVYFLCSTLSNGSWTNHKIWEYDEDLETVTEIQANWSYSGGEIDGYVSTNQSGEKILTIAEYVANGEVPLKHINLSYCANNTNESLYCQAPKCPTANLVLINTYVKTIPNGVYVFFIRYKIRKDVYTNWFLCSRPIFGGTSEKITTLQGGLSYINLHRDSAKSFVFNLNFVQTTNISSYKEFQLGFIITHDEATDARAWKHFNIDNFNGTIYFDYEDVEDINIDDLLETTYELYNVHNITSFKNKLYISNYVESNFNPNDINTLASKINISVKHSGGTDVNYRNLKLNNTTLSFNYNKGYYDETAISHQSVTTLITSANLFNYDITKLSKVSSKEKEDILLFDIIWKGSTSEGGYDPDIAIIYNIYNNIYNKEVFGNDYRVPYGFTTSNDLIDTGMGVTRVAIASNLYGYRHSSSVHPWYNLGLTFAFGSFNETDIGSAYARDGAFAFNNDSEDLYSVDGVTSWPTRDSGFIDSARNFIDNELKRQTENKSFWGKAYIEVSSGGNVYTIGYNSIMDLDNYAGSSDFTQLNNDLFSTDTISSTLKNNIETWIYQILSNSTYLVGIDESGIPVIKIDGKEIRANSVSIRFKKFDFKVDIESLTTTEEIYNKRYRVSMTTTDYTSICTFNFKNGVINIGSTSTDQASTLMPHSKYQPYVHFVDEHNIITNGVKCGGPIEVLTASSNADVISLQYSVGSLTGLTTKYKSFFISLVNIGDIVMEGFGYCKDPNSNTTNILQCLEIDSLLYNINDNITIFNENNTIPITTSAKYYPSGSSYPTLAFGNCGYITWEGSASDNYSNNKLYIKVVRNRSSENINNLVKSSGYINFAETSITDVPDGYYGSWLCFVKKPSFDLASTCYVSGNDVYSMDRNTSLGLREFNGYVQVQNSVTYFIRSNYNLNYLSLTEDIADKIFPVGGIGSGVKQVAKVINSATLSSIYELKSMYRDFANKYFRKYDTDYKIDFDNTIRVSHVLSDETFNNSVFKFSAEDYYNVPTDRGIIVNLFAISNNIFVHTKGSFYKFDGNQTLVTNNSNDVQLQESEPFELGITQLFDSEYGYGGIENKQSGCITFDSYFFYDRASNHIFGYSGNAQIQMIDANIYKTLAYYKPIDCRTLHDEANCRILFEFITNSTNEYKTFTLSFNYKTKTFISLHDLSLINAFASRHKDYSYKVNTALINLFDTSGSISTTPLSNYGTFMNVNNIFGTATIPCMIEFGAAIYKAQATPFGIAVVVMPRQTLRETVDSIKYISDVISPCIEVRTKTTEETSVDVYDVLVYPQTTRTNPVVNFYIITNTCISSLITTTVDDTSRPDIDHTNPDDDRRDKPNDPNKAYTTLMDYKGFKYDMGFWACNYFRNKYFEDDAHKDIYSYGVPYPNRNLNSDLNSLVYGRYFILNFDFKADTPIKFEEIFVNSDKY